MKTHNGHVRCLAGFVRWVKRSAGNWEFAGINRAGAVEPRLAIHIGRDPNMSASRHERPQSIGPGIHYIGKSACIFNSSRCQRAHQINFVAAANTISASLEIVAQRGIRSTGSQTSPYPACTYQEFANRRLWIENIRSVEGSMIAGDRTVCHD